MPSILVIDDSQAARESVRQAVREAGLFDRIVEARDGFEGLKELMAAPFDMVLCDLELPALDGEKLLRLKEQSPSGSHVPFLFMTASSSRERKLRLLEDGAVDLIEKPFEARELCARLRLHLKIKHLQDELIEKNRRLEALSLTDGLTGLANRRGFDAALEKEVARAKRYKRSFALLMADVDHFKGVNDEYGHAAGDQVLRETAHSIFEWLRRSDTGARYGGEEFAVVLLDNDAEDAHTVAERWRGIVEGTTHELPDGRRCSVTVSVGIAVWSAGYDSAEAMLEAADAALYRAKGEGRNRVVVADPPPSVRGPTPSQPA